MTSVNAFATLLEAFFNIFLQTHTHTDTHTHTHRHHGIVLPLLHMRMQGNNTQLSYYSYLSFYFAPQRLLVRSAEEKCFKHND